MENFNFRTMRLVSIAVFLCLLFGLLIMNAYKYLPENDNNPQTNVNKLYNNTNIRDDKLFKDTEEEDDDTKEEDTDDNIEELESQQIQAPLTELEDLDEIPTPEELKKVEINNKTPFEETFIEAQNAKKEKNYADAINKFSNALTFTDDLLQKANCYEQLAIIHAIEKHYGTALSFIQKAYNIEPTTQREILLARIYYKIGEKDKASQRINNVLQRDFAYDK